PIKSNALRETDRRTQGGEQIERSEKPVHRGSSDGRRGYHVARGFLGADGAIASTASSDVYLPRSSSGPLSRISSLSSDLPSARPDEKGRLLSLPTMM